jgi:D-alanyl-D-alanine carboxypeptidase
MKTRAKWISVILSVVCLLQFSTISVQAKDYWPKGPQIQGEAAIVMEASTGTILYKKNINKKLYPASITKILTTLIALENCSLDEKVTFSYDSVHNIDKDSTHIWRDVDEVMTLEECLYGVMLGSANDCAYAVAEHVGGSYDKFIKMMNKKAKELGCKNSNFTNPHGLPDENHYTSAKDMAIISQAAMKNKTFRKITKTKQFVIPKTNKHPNDETPINNHHKMLFPYKGDSTYLYENCIGGKTGFTQAALSTLVTFAEKDNMTLICVVLREEGMNHWTDSRALIDYCFENFQMLNIAENESNYIINGTADSQIFGDNDSFLGVNQDDYIVLPKSASFADTKSKVINSKLSNDVVASLQYSYAGRKVGEAKITVSKTEVKQYSFQEKVKPVMAKPVTNKSKPFQFNRTYIIFGTAALAILIITLIAVFYLVNNYQRIRHKFSYRSSGNNSGYKIIQTRKHSRWRKR